LFGQSQYNGPSRFLGELPEHLITTVKRKKRRPSMEAERPIATVAGSDIGSGDRVRHAHWGVGTVREIFGSGERAEALVRFDGLGDKRLLLAWAPLEKVGEQVG
jgi:DNA helicase-2/ATP-dependent DNA helicase PcrA